MEPLYQFFWKVGKNPSHSIPEGAAIFFEGGFRRLKCEFDVECDPSSTTFKVTESSLRLKVSEPEVYWQVGEGDRHYIPEEAKILAKLHKSVSLFMFLAEKTCHMEFSYGKMKKGQKVVVVSDATEAWANRSPVWHYYVKPETRISEKVSTSIWNLKAPVFKMKKAG